MIKDKIEVSIKDIPEIIETLKEAEKEIEFERKSKNLFIDNLYKVCDMSLKQSKEIERLNNIIKEVREYIEENRVKATKYFNAFDGSLCMDKKYVDKLLEILDKGE